MPYSLIYLKMDGDLFLSHQHPHLSLKHRHLLSAMLRLQLCARTFTGAGDFADHQTLFSNQVGRSSASISYSIPQLKHYHRRRSEPIVISCNSSSGGRSNRYRYEHGDDYEAVVLMAETIMHYQMRMHGYQEKIKRQSSGKFFSLSGQGKDPRANIQTIGPDFLQQYQNPTIFLKISCDCDGDYLLPIIVGEYAVEKLISSSLEDEGSPNQFQLVRNIVGKLGYEVKQVQITERVNNIYYASIRFHKPGEEDIRVDARPSDAINVAKRCKAPIYVNKRIVFSDAVKIVYGMGRLRDKKPTYDVFLDSAIDGLDKLAEELNLVIEMNLAAKEERYNDAVMWRDKLLKLRGSTNEP